MSLIASVTDSISIIDSITIVTDYMAFATDSFYLFQFMVTPYMTHLIFQSNLIQKAHINLK